MFEQNRYTLPLIVNIQLRCDTLHISHQKVLFICVPNESKVNASGKTLWWGACHSVCMNVFNLYDIEPCAFVVVFLKLL